MRSAARWAFFVCCATLLLPQGFGPSPQSARLRADLEFLTSDVLAGRLSLTPQADIAARYIAADFQKSGLQPANGNSYLQEFPLIAYRADAKSREMIVIRNGVSKPLQPGTDFTGAFSRDLHLRAAAVFAGYGITAPEYQYDDYAGLDAKGKIVVIFDHEPQEERADSVFNGAGHTLHAGRVIKVANARRHGAVGVLIASEPRRGHRGLLEAAGGGGSGQSVRASAPPQSIDDSGQIPAFSIGDAALEQLLAPTGRKPSDLQQAIDDRLKPQSQPLSDTVIELRSSNLEERHGTSLNAVGLLEGSDPALKSETVIVCAHYDHLGVQNARLYPGANDNASGTAGVMEVARLFGNVPARPKRSVLFIVFGSEEELMLGSFYYTAHPLRPLAGTKAVLNLDMIGRDDVLEPLADTTNHLNLIGTYQSPKLAEVIRREDLMVGLTLDTRLQADRTLNVLFRCDHLPFLAEGIPAIWFFGGFHAGYHEPSDTVEKLNFPKMAKVVRLAYSTAASVANQP